ncbi:MAG: hypothetical protein JWO72_1966 [Caulobacteraceae bacterium]|jgi:hypothetical protein|nr:hypothetical protein [Caulobacteraceae bacterium]
MRNPTPVHTPAWRNFRRMQDCACLFASLIYAGAVIHAWRVLPGPNQTKLIFTLAAPLIFLSLVVLLPVAIGGLRRQLRRYVWMSFNAGFGQTPGSIISGLGLLAFAAVFIYLQIAGVAKGGRYPAGVFSGYAAGIGILFVQAVLVRSLERDPEIRRRIEAAP